MFPCSIVVYIKRESVLNCSKNAKRETLIQSLEVKCELEVGLHNMHGWGTRPIALWSIWFKGSVNIITCHKSMCKIVIANIYTYCMTLSLLRHNMNLYNIVWDILKKSRVELVAQNTTYCINSYTEFLHIHDCIYNLNSTLLIN